MSFFHKYDRTFQHFQSLDWNLSASEWQHRTDAALAWVRRSIAATGGRGSSHNWSPIFGWEKAYPETTGYLIETLRDYARLKNDPTLNDLADNCADWLCTVQLPNGAFPALLADSGQPSVFNTAMVLFGRPGCNGSTPPPTPPPKGRGATSADAPMQGETRAMTPDAPMQGETRAMTPDAPMQGETRAMTPDAPMQGEGSVMSPGTPMQRETRAVTRLPFEGGAGGGVKRGVDYLLRSLSPDGSWRTDAYVPGFVPAYYTRAVWSVLKAGRSLQHPDTDEAMRHALHYYAGRFLPSGAIRDWGFWPGKAAFTHTIAYTMEGFLESALLLGEAEILEKTIASANALLQQIEKNGRTAGRYDEAWGGDHSFYCLTGNAQLSVVFRRLWEVTGEVQFQQTAQFLLWEIIDFQNLGKNKNAFGTLPGSAPFWGKYVRLRYPNWAAKFFLDAMKGTMNDEI